MLQLEFQAAATLSFCSNNPINFPIDQMLSARPASIADVTRSV